MLRLTAPSKTFLLGEYVALQGGPALVLASQPCFALSVKYTSENQPVIFENIHQESPAGKYLLKHAAVFKGYHLLFHDPHHNLGGFGASSAQFLLVNNLKQVIKTPATKLTCSAPHLLNDYLTFAWDGQGFMPSGADVIAQMQGGISYFYKTQNRLQKISWPFTDIHYYLLHTGSKIPTHQHLKELSSLTTHKLVDIVFSGLQHMQTSNAQGFIDCINQYAQGLQALNLVLPDTAELLATINARSEVLAAKGCGALGADVILVLVKAENHAGFSDWLNQQKLRLITYGNQAAAGLQITYDVDLIL